MKMKYVWLNQNRTQSARHFQNSSEVMLDTSIKKNIHEHSRLIKKMKRFRSAFTTYQISYLETEFRKFPYIGTIQRKEVSAALKIPERAVKIWFQNRRMKEKKEINLREPHDGKSGEKIHEPTEEEFNIAGSVQPTIGTQMDSLPLIINNVYGSKNTNCNIQKLRDVNDIKVTASRDRASKAFCNNCINISKVIATPALTLCQNNESHKVLSAQFSFDSGKHSNKNINEDNAKQRQAQLKESELTSINRIIGNNGYGIPADLSIRKQKVSPQNKQREYRTEDNSPSKKIKRFRSAFTTEQTSYLEREFKKIQYIGSTQRKVIADALSIPESAVKIWFQNRRMKEKKETCVKEFEEHTNRKMLKCPKEQFIDLTDVQSTNEEASCSMPLEVTRVNNVINSIHDSKTYNNTINIKETVKTNSEVKDYKIQAYDSLLVENSKILLNCNTHSINLCKDNKKIDNMQQEQSLINDLHPKCHQDMPQDLSLKKKKSSQTQSAELKLTHLMSNFCPNTYITDGGVLWNPINILPVVSTGSSVPLSVNNSSNLLKCNVKCNCDCHMKMVPVPMVLQQNSTSPHFILTTMPLDKQQLSKSQF